jgi:hypothetical protein
MMNNNGIVVRPDKTRLVNLLGDIAEGSVKIPIFQREFVWKAKQMIDLFDSIVKGYPIGSLLFWKPNEKYRTFDGIGPHKIEASKDNLSYVLDGYQRITTLFGVLTNPKNYNKTEASVEMKEYLIYYDLSAKEFTYLKSRRQSKEQLIPLYKIVDTFEFLDFLREMEKDILDKTERNRLIENAKQISKILYDYEVPFVEIKGGNIQSAVEIFSRVNSTGMEISEDFMLSALSYNTETNFLLSNSITDFLNSLKSFNFDELKRDTILNCISCSTGNIYFDTKIEDLLHYNIEQLTNSAIVHIGKAVEFLYTRLNIFDTRLLPYPAQLIFISEYFRLNISPSEAEILKLINWFWVTSYSNYFSIYSLSQHRSAYKVFKDFALGRHPDGVFKLNPGEKFISLKFPDKINFTGVRTKTLQLFLLKKINECNNDVQVSDSVKELFVFNKKDRTPANMILRLGSEFERDSQKKDIKNFISNSPNNVLEKYFIDEAMVQDFRNNRIDDFVNKREALIKEKERSFVDNLGIDYVD